jgi:hypothetical protein
MEGRKEGGRAHLEKNSQGLFLYFDDERTAIAPHNLDPLGIKPPSPLPSLPPSLRLRLVLEGSTHVSLLADEH